jgi:hypothetical protein
VFELATPSPIRKDICAVVTVFSLFGTFTDYLLKGIESTGIYHKIEKSCVATVVYCLPFDHSATIARGFFHLEKIEVGL